MDKVCKKLIIGKKGGKHKKRKYSMFVKEGSYILKGKETGL